MMSIVRSYSQHSQWYQQRQQQQKDKESIDIDMRIDTGTGRIIVYGRRIDRCKELAELLGCEMYIAEAKDKAIALQRWVAGETQTIVATNALGLGIDVADVGLVLHAEASFDLLNYGQESGRAGRDGKKAKAMVLVVEERIPSRYKDTDQRLLWEYLQTKDCRRIKLDQYLDGNLDTVECVEGQEACDNCTQRQRRSHIAREDEHEQEEQGHGIKVADIAEYREQEK